MRQAKKGGEGCYAIARFEVGDLGVERYRVLLFPQEGKEHEYCRCKQWHSRALATAVQEEKILVLVTNPPSNVCRRINRRTLVP